MNANLGISKLARAALTLGSLCAMACSARVDTVNAPDATVNAPDATVNAPDAATPSDDGGGQDASDAAIDSALPSSSRYPADLLDLASWKITVPVETDHPGDPDEHTQPELASFELEPYFMLSPSRDSVLFRAHAGGATTSGSDYPRSELREMSADGAQEASWSTTSGTHSMTVRQAITHLPVEKPHVVAGQIHDAEDDVIMIRLEGSHLFVEAGGDEVATLDSAYELGTIFSVRLVASGGHIRVFYDGEMKLDLERDSEGCYFKAGCYTQSNTSRGDEASAYGEVAVYELTLTHE